MMTRSFASLVVALATLPGAALAQQNPFHIEGLVVTASPTARPASAMATHVTLLDGDELRAEGLVRVQDALARVPGVAMVQNGSTGAVTSMFMRGGESDYVLVLIDGVQVNLPGGAFDFSSLSLANVERIEVVRGPSSALYGSDAVSGVVHIITESGGGAPTYGGEVRAGSYARRDITADLRGGTERAGYSVALSRLETDGVLELNNRYRADVLSGTLRLSPDDATHVRMSARVTSSEYHFPTDGVGNVVDANAFTYGDQMTISVAALRRIRPSLDVQTTLGLAEMDGGTDDAPDGPDDSSGYYGFTSLDHVRRSSADVRANLRFGGVVATLGWELEEERQRSFNESLSEYGPTTGRSSNERWNRAYYVHVTGEHRAVSFNAGARMEDNERFGRLGTFQLGAAVRAGDGGPVVRASLGRGIKEPTFYETFATGFATGNPDLQPERALSWEAGVDQSLAGGSLTLRATWFNQGFRDLIQYTFTPPTPGGANFFNVAKADARGLELAADVAVGRFSGGAGWTLLDTEVADAGFDEGDGAEFVQGDRLLRRPRHTVSAFGSVRMSGSATLSANLEMLGARDDRDFSSYPATRVQLARTTLVAVGGEWALRGRSAGRTGVWLTVRGENLLDRRYEPVAGFFAPGRSLNVGLRLGFGG